jgi:hypothetical protein
VKRFWLYLLTLAPLPVLAQTAGKQSFQFLHVPNNARLSALGGVNVSLNDQDLNLFYSNPALVSDTLNRWASVSYQFYVGDIGQATFSYAHSFKHIGMLAMGVQHLNYGEIKGYDATGMETGNFKSGETALYISKSHEVNNFRFGVNLKGVFSNIAGYRSNAVMIDLGGTFIHPKKKLTVGLVMKNLGFVLSDYSSTSTTKIPFDLQAGATFRPEHMPLRFSLTAYDLARSKITYAQNGEKNGTFDKVLRRFNFATEILVHKNVTLMVGYNYRTHQELKLSSGGGGAGISFGFNAKIKSIDFSFSRSGFVAGSAGYSFTIAANTQKFLTRR